jgi:lipopolysaccharide/colanic/teichoic acid biosynthesis glycosyltransferase
MLHGSERKRLLEALYKQYVEKDGSKLTYKRKKYGWLFVISATKLLKRTLDIVLGSLGLIIFFPLMLLIAAAIKLSDRGPIFYISNRIGKWGREFRCAKFRTMQVDAENRKGQILELNIHPENPSFKAKEDPRTTPLGRFLRKLSLDELPQLYNVVRGEMSLVGPRPPLPSEVASYTLEERRRLDVTPGLTCIWQVSGRSDIPFAQQVQLDLQYIESQSLWLDCLLLLKTIPAVLFGRGAY